MLKSLANCEVVASFMDSIMAAKEDAEHQRQYLHGIVPSQRPKRKTNRRRYVPLTILKKKKTINNGDLPEGIPHSRLGSSRWRVYSAHRNVHKELKEEMPKVLKFLQAFKTSVASLREKGETSKSVAKIGFKAIVDKTDVATDVPLWTAETTQPEKMEGVHQEQPLKKRRW